MSLVLLLNTCGAAGVVALSGEDGVRANELLPERGTSEHLMPAIRRVLGGTRLTELAGIRVVVGPGSFTGVRAGLSAAKGLCEAGAVGMIAMSRLELVAAGVEGEGYTVAVLDAGRGEFFCGVYRLGERLAERLVKREEACAAIKHGRAVTCEVRVSQELGADMRLVPEPGPEAMFAMMKNRMRAGEWSDVGSADANYLRRTDAELAAERR